MAWVKWWYGALGVISVLNGMWMLVDPATWYSQIPAAVPDTGPLNNHFVHDIGVAFLLAGIGGLWCFRHIHAEPDKARMVHWGMTGFIGGHALVHVAEISLGVLPSNHWLIDAPLVFGPALVLAYLSVPAVWQKAVSV